MSKTGTSAATSFLWKTGILVLALAMNITLAYRLIWGDQSVQAWQDLKDLQNSLTEQRVALDLRQAAISQEIRLLQTDSAYVEKVIRQRLNYVRNSEVLYLFDELRPEDQKWAGAELDDGKN